MKRLLDEAAAAAKLDSLLTAAAKDRTLYRNPEWLRGVLAAAWTLYQCVPLPPEERQAMNTIIAKVGAASGLAAVLVGALTDPNTVNFITALAGSHANGFLHALTIVGSVAATVFGYVHPSPVQATDQLPK